MRAGVVVDAVVGGWAVVLIVGGLAQALLVPTAMGVAIGLFPGIRIAFRRGWFAGER